MNVQPNILAVISVILPSHSDLHLLARAGNRPTPIQSLQTIHHPREILGDRQQLDALQALRQEVRGDLLAESRKHSAMNLLRQIPSIGPIRAALLIALIQTPHRFRTKRQLWAYSGLFADLYQRGIRLRGGATPPLQETSGDWSTESLDKPTILLG